MNTYYVWHEVNGTEMVLKSRLTYAQANDIVEFAAQNGTTLFINSTF